MNDLIRVSCVTAAKCRRQGHPEACIDIDINININIKRLKISPREVDASVRTTCSIDEEQ